MTPDPGNAQASPVREEAKRPAKGPEKKSRPVPDTGDGGGDGDGGGGGDGDSGGRRSMLVVVASLTAVTLLVGAGLFFWFSNSDPEPSQKTAGTTKGKSAGKDSKEQEVKQSPAIDPGLLAHWKFDEQNSAWAANDVSPLTLTMRGTPEFTPGPMGHAIKLDGKDDVLELPTGSLTAQAGTIAFWVRRDSDDGVRPAPLISTVKTGTRFNLSLSASGHATGTVGPQAKELTTKVTLAPHQWYHLALTWQPSGQALLFCNAEKIGEVEDAGPFVVADGLTMGATPGDQPAANQAKAMAAAQNSHSLASFDDVRCFDRALKADELTALLAESSTELKPPRPYTGEPETQSVAEPMTEVAKVDTPSPNPEVTTPAPSKKKSKNSKPANTPPPPQPPAMRTVQLPQGVNDVSSIVWKNVEADEFSQFVSSNPTSKPTYRRLTSLSAGSKERLGPKAFQRVRGVLIPPVDGPYKFNVAFVDQGQFRLSNGLNPTGLKEVKDGQTVELSGTQTYYFEVLHLDNSGKGSFRIGWTFPNGAKEPTIQAGRLMWTPHVTNFVALPVSHIQSTDSLTVEQVKDSNLILASGDPRAASTVTVEFQSDVTNYTAFRLDAVVNEELLPNGPGLGSRGMFSLSEITLEYQEPGSTTLVPVPLDAPIAHMGVPETLVDGNEDTKWSVRGRGKELTSVILIPRRTLTVRPQTKFRLTLHQETPLGLFRVLGTSASANWQIESMRRQMERADQPLALHVNFGGPKWTDPEGTTWLPSRAYKEGSWGHVGGQAQVRKGAASKAVCLDSAIVGISAFRVDLPNGRYDVTLFFSEHWVTKPGQRVFTIQVESDPPVPVDSFVAAGSGNKVFAPSAPVVVKDGRLDIVFRKASGTGPILNAISITE